MAPRRKAARIEAPATIEQATALVAEYLELGASMDQCKADADAALRQIETARDELIKPVEARMKDLFIQLRTWWAVARPDLTEGKRKSYELAGALLGDRTTTPALKFPKGWKVEDAVGFIQSLTLTWEGAKEFLRTKVEVEKPALIKLLGNVTAVGPLVDRIREEGFRVEQKEEFFIDRAGKKEADPVVETPIAETVA